MKNSIGIGLLAVVLVSVPTGAQQGSEGLTAGALALLALEPTPAALATVRSAIDASDPVTRAAAARVLAVTSDVPAADALAAAFAREQDPDAAVEQATALLFLRGTSAGTLIEARLADAGYLAPRYASWLSLVAPERLAATLPALASSAHARSLLNPLLHAAIRRTPALGESVARARYRTATPAQWQDFVSTLRLDEPWAMGLLTEALESDDARKREASVWALVGKVAAEEQVPADVLAAAIDRAPADGAPDAPADWEQFGRELLARHQRKTRTPDRSALIRASGEQGSVRVLALAERLLTRPEIAEVRSTLGRDGYAAARRRVPEPASAASGRSMRLLPVRWIGFLRQLLDAARCPVDRAFKFGIAAVGYGPDGRVKEVALNDNPLPDGCRLATRVLARLSLADATYSLLDGAREWLLLPLDAEWVGCASDSAPTYRGSPAHTIRPDSRVEVPEKVRHVNPGYPPSLQARGVTGVVLLEAEITGTGCVRTAKVLRTPDPSFSASALHAVSGWRFKPTVIDGVAVPVVMTVTVSFALQE
jgi:TonB family protein